MDLDLLVIEPEEVTKRRAESARLRRELRGLDVALDVIVISARHAEDASIALVEEVGEWATTQLR